MIIRNAVNADIEHIMPIIDAARQIMRQSGNTQQWIRGYPSQEVIAADISNHVGYVVETDDGIVAYFAFMSGPEPTYADIYNGAWLNNEPYYVIHRLASLPDVYGIFDNVIDWALLHTSTLRIDTHQDNTIMQHLLRKRGFAYCGIIYLASGDPRMAYQIS